MDYVGRDVLLPVQAFDPPLDEPVAGYITKLTQPSLRFPEGRYEVQPLGSKLKYMWPREKFEASWVLSTSTYASVPKTPAKKVPRTPKASKPPATSDGGESSDGGASGSRPRGRPRSRPPSAPTSPAKPPADKSSGTGPSSAIDLTGDTPSKSPSRSRSRSPRGGAAGSRTPGGAPATGTKSLLRNPTRSASGFRVTFKDVPAMHQLTEVPRLSVAGNIFNFLLMVGVAVPALLLGYAVCTASPSDPALSKPVTLPPVKWEEVLMIQWWQRVGLQQPLVFVNAVFLINVDVLFWIIALVQGTTWLIDPYWTITPVMILRFYQLHPLATTYPWRAIAASTLLCIWSIRLTWSYFRREEWQFGAREDWRFTDLSKRFGFHWWWLSFWATYVTQHLMLVGITVPLYAVYSSTAPWSYLDTLATVMTASGMIISTLADNQLREFMVINEARRDTGLQPMLILESGLWYYSRHPNYFGEQLFWWGLATYAVGLGQPWMVVGTLFNSLCMVAVTYLTEARMMRRPERAAQFREYQRTTSVWVPWFKATDKMD